MVNIMMNAYYENLNYPFTVRFGSDLSFGAHLHRQVEIFYVLEGEVDIRIDTVLKTVKAPGLSIAFPNTVHSYETKNHCRFAILIFDITLAGEYTNLLTHYRCKDSFISPEQMHSDIYYSIEALMKEKGTMDIRLVKAFFSIILRKGLLLTSTSAGNLIPASPKNIVSLTGSFSVWAVVVAAAVPAVVAFEPPALVPQPAIIVVSITAETRTAAIPLDLFIAFPP
jgi:hypothetical protein